MKIWAHRGCSQRHPENTITAFSRACELKELAGIELDIQLTRDGQIVVLHDERLDRTTNATGFIRDYNSIELRNVQISTGTHRIEHIPTMEEVFDCIEERLKEGMLLNIELKTSVYPYPGIEEKIVELVAKRGLEDSVVYSSFSAKSLIRLHEINPTASIGMLDTKISDCLIKTYGLESIFYAMDTDEGADGILCPDIALHPHWKDIDYDPIAFEGRTVRAWFTGHLFPEVPTGTKLGLDILEKKGITDVFLNEPEAYIK